MKKALILILWMTTWTSHSFGQGSTEVIVRGFEAYPPLREMKCGLWMNAIGDIAYKGFGCETDVSEDEITIDSLGNKLFVPEKKSIDNYISWTYNIRDSIPGDISEDDFIAQFTSELKNVIDTASFKILSPSYFMDKNHIYIHNVMMVCGGEIFIAHNLDRKTFRVFESNPDFACDKHSCFASGRQLVGADPKTFKPIIHKDHPLLSRDKKHVYDWTQPMTEKEITEMETELGIKL